MSAGDADRRARAALCRLAEPGDDELARLVASLGAVEVLARLGEGSLDVRSARHWSARLGTFDPDADWRRAVRHGLRYVVPGDDEWPERLDDLELLREAGVADCARPLGLWVCGPLDLRAAMSRSVSVVGTRSSTAYGELVAGHLGYELAERGWTVVSGAAFGIDGRAHRAALAADGRTAAVLACGADTPYPRAHSSLIAQIAARGLVLSELAPGCSPTRVRFLRRNRLIAALTAATVVVEAAYRSGSLSTATHARRLDRYVCAVPGSVESAMSAGCNQLLREPDTFLVRDAADVIELVGALGEDAVVEPRGPAAPLDGLDPVTQRVAEALPVRVPAHLESVSRVAGLQVREVQVALGRLELAGLAERLDGGWRRVRAGES